MFLKAYFQEKHHNLKKNEHNFEHKLEKHWALPIVAYGHLYGRK